MGWIEADDDKGDIFLINSTDNGNTFGNKTKIPLNGTSNPGSLRLAVSPAQPEPEQEGQEDQQARQVLFSPHLPQQRERIAALDHSTVSTAAHFTSISAPPFSEPRSSEPSSASPPVILAYIAKTPPFFRTDVLMTQITKSQSGGNQFEQTNLSEDPGNNGKVELVTAPSITKGTNFNVAYVGTSEYDPNVWLITGNTASDNITKQSVNSGTGTESLPSDVFLASSDSRLQIGFVKEKTVFAAECTEGGNTCTVPKEVSEGNVTCPTPSQTTNPASSSGLNDTTKEAGTPELTPTANPESTPTVSPTSIRAQLLPHPHQFL